jgi:hypothetical protein
MSGNTGADFSTDSILALLSPRMRPHEQSRPGVSLRRNGQLGAGAWLRCLPKGPCHATAD